MIHYWMQRPASEVAQTARALLGWYVSANGVHVRLTEVEAYSGEGVDPASHAHRGRTARTAVMFGPPGRAYVYFVYGMHWCLNVVCGHEGEAAAVLLRAGEVVNGVDIAQSRRGVAVRAVDLARGPARLATALGIDERANGTSMVDGTGPITLTPPETPIRAALITSGPRVGVTSAPDVPWRFWIAGDRAVSTYRRHVPRRHRRTP
jgi:DNA-3-methyladenine glycosylase